MRVGALSLDTRRRDLKRMSNDARQNPLPSECSSKYAHRNFPTQATCSVFRDRSLSRAFFVIQLQRPTSTGAAFFSLYRFPFCSHSLR